MKIRYFEFKYEPDSFFWRHDEEKGFPSDAIRVRILMEADGKRFGFQHLMPQHDSLTDTEIDHMCRRAAEGLKAAVKRAQAEDG